MQNRQLKKKKEESFMDSWIGHIGSLFLSSINQRKKKKQPKNKRLY